MLVRSKKVEISRVHPARLHENGEWSDILFWRVMGQ
jgi:hypothetical protein